MIRNLTDVAALAAVGGALTLTACSEEGDDDTTMDTGVEAGCPTGGCPTGGCPTGGCPTGGCPTGGCPTGGDGTSGYVAEYATDAGFFTLMAGPVSGTSPHGSTQIWYSTDLQTLIEGGGSFTAPVGATAIKEFDNGATGILVMTKQEAGFDSANGDWLYDVREADGTLTSSSANAGCIGCHAGFPMTDYLGGTTLR